MKELNIDSLSGKRIFLGVSGSIAAYKAADICSQLSKLESDIHVVLTAHAAKFVGEATFRALTRNPVLVDIFDEPTAKRIAHIDLAQSADLILLAPASANLLAKMAHGIADDMLTTCLLATPLSTPILAAPAMNTVMWEHPATRANIETLQSRGVQIVEPYSGLLACQDVGMGKLATIEEIVNAVVRRLHQNQYLAGRKILVTAGATREPLDPVRFLSNRSSGKMGFAIAAEAASRGADVTVVSGFTSVIPPDGIEVVQTLTAQSMFEECSSRFSSCDVFIAAAAVSDFTPIEPSDQKIKKSSDNDNQFLSIELKRTTDIVSTLAKQKRKDQVVVGFAVETGDLLVKAHSKLASKNLDLLVANDVTQQGAGFDTDTNIVSILWADGRIEDLPLLTKREVAEHILNVVKPMLSE